MKILELFAGKNKFSTIARDEFDAETFTSDIKEMDGIDYVIDINNFDVNKVPFIPDVIWASPDCAVWSKASGNLHFDAKSLKPKTQKAKNAFLMIDKMLEIIAYFLKLNPNLLYYIENPVGRLNWVLMPGTLFNKVDYKFTITQNSYGKLFRKPTHIFTNNKDFIPRPINKEITNLNLCNYGDGKSRYYLRASLPDELCCDVLKQSIIE